MNLPRFDAAKVLVLGDAILDRYWHGTTDRISPEAPIPVVDVVEIEDRLGGAANVALNISALGANAGLIAAVGEDESGNIIKAKLESLGIKDWLITLDEYATTTKLRILSQNQQLVRADFERAVAVAPDCFQPQLDEALTDADALVLSDYDKGAISDPQGLIQAAVKQQVAVLVDPKFKDFDLYRGATIIKPNEKECRAAIGGWTSEAEFIKKCQLLIQHLGLNALLVTRGSEGLTLIEKNQQELHLPAWNSEVYDVSGAGDTVIAVVAAALAAGQTLVDSVGLANIAAGIVVGRVGTATVSGPELRLEVEKETAMMSGQNPGRKNIFGNGVMSEEQLVIAVDEARAQGEKIVFTNGCFDILHAGHVEYLAEAKALGHRLIVAINSDESVFKLKGEGRPINTVDRRMSMLAGLSAVDWVVCFSTETPEPLLSKVRPDVLVKGGDYTIEGVVGAEIVKQYNGMVKVLKMVDDLSTTGLAQKIKAL
ncbi:MAG: bifunctional D-glycero-beta-D-manno-heptose-7-phosphate kinase/D-glycero-beta-D-manno-heptose 1-phosphate adenylyltransferase HldE [Pseudomonadales bacterium]|nr:bifunctional D-glycero-beta-D-manno-heptose-7-phosphate kinase/D-glycero-beta-D-manno-heptose 1-phosphate adenylyltransferase HldE [Pseudomonadales bacterium]